MASKKPINVKKLLDVVTNLGEERDLPLAVDLVFDITANDELIDEVIVLFEAQDSSCNVRSVLLQRDVPCIETPCDLCVIVGGTSILLGDVAAAARAKGIPAVVLSAKGEIAYTDCAELAYSNVHIQDNETHKGIYEDDLLEIDLAQEEPFLPLAHWIFENASAKRLALAAHFQFLQRPLCLELIQSASIQNGAIGVVAFVPGADMPLITLNQARLVLQIALIYGNALDRDRVKEILAVIAGAFGFRAIARELSKLIPGIGIAIKAGIAYSATLAIGHVALDYFADGGKVAEFASTLKDAAESVVNSTVSTVTRAGNSESYLSDISKRVNDFIKDGPLNEILTNIEYDKRNFPQ